MAALTAGQQALLAAVQRGDVLKVHRTLDGDKTHMLHPLDGAPAFAVPARDVEALVRAGYIASNMKFPAATYVPGRGR
jgi:hypothetical protein